MKSSFTTLFTIFFCILLFLACTKDINNVVKPGDKPIINAYLAPGQPVNMKIYTEIPYTATDSAYSKPIVGMKIQITQSNGKNFTLTGDAEGNYISANSDKIGPVGTSVSMAFSYNGRLVSATTIIPSKPTGFKMDQTEITRVARDLSAGFGGGPGGGGGGFLQEARVTINVNWNNPDNTYYFVAAQSLEPNPQPVIILPANTTNDNRRQRRFNNQPIQGNSSSLPSQNFNYFGKYGVILYRLNPDYAALYLNNSTTSQNIATPVGTISNGLGIFTGVNADTLTLNVLKAQ
jgi:hypothetical protein